MLSEVRQLLHITLTIPVTLQNEHFLPCVDLKKHKEKADLHAIPNEFVNANERRFGPPIY